MTILNRLRHSNLFKSTLIYGTASAFNSALPFFLLPILTRYLNPSDYGHLTVFMTLMGFFNVFVGLNVNGAVFNKYFFLKSEGRESFGEYLGSAVAVLLASAAVMSLVGTVLFYFFSDYFQIPLLWVLVAVACSFFQYINQTLLSVLQAEQKALRYALLVITQAFFNLGLSFLLVIILNYNWVGRSGAIFSAYFLTALISLFILFKRFALKLNWNLDLKKDILKFGLPLVPHALGAVLISLADRFIISEKVGLHEAGLYQAGIQISMGILFLSDAFNKAYAPWLYGALQKNSDDLKLKIVKLTYLYFTAMFVLSLLIGVIPESIITSLLGEKFSGSQQYIFWSSLGYGFNSMYLMVCNYIFYSNKTKYLAYITLPIGLLNVILSYSLVDKFGAIGASQSMAISFFLMFVFTWYRSSKLVTMPWGFKSY